MMSSRACVSRLLLVLSVLVSCVASVHAQTPADSAAAALAAARPDHEPAFDIGLVTGADTLVVAFSEPSELHWREPGGEDQSARVSGAMTVRRSGTQALVEPEGSARALPLAVLGPQDTLWVGGEDLVAGDRPVLQWNGHHWRGRFKVFLSPNGGITLATRVGLEHYLLGVVPGEIGGLKDSLLEAGRAQAIAARSYSLFYRGRRGREGFDLYATVEDQMYVPTESERPLATQCVEGTRGQVVLSEGLPIRANYCSTCGGISAEVWEAWPTDSRPYLRSVRDQGVGAGDHCALSPQYRWREEWSAGGFLATIARYAPTQGVALPAGGLGELRDVQVLVRSRSGRVWMLSVTTTTGEVRIPAYSLRQVLHRPNGNGNGNGTGNGAILRSNLFKIGVRRDAAGQALAVVASGAGSGHGVGLCQTGALAMARHGAAADRILGHYYPGTSLERLY